LRKPPRRPYDWRPGLERALWAAIMVFAAKYAPGALELLGAMQ
jgi:hypothetical protein